jgi:L-aspartate oxidase
LTETTFDQSQLPPTITDWGDNTKARIDANFIEKTKAELQLLMRQNAGIVRNDRDLLVAQKRLNQLEADIKTATQTHQVNANLWELYNLIILGKIIVSQSILRNGNCGGFVKTETYN